MLCNHPAKINCHTWSTVRLCVPQKKQTAFRSAADDHENTPVLRVT